MSVKIELLQYEYTKGNIIDWPSNDKPPLTDWNTNTGITITAGGGSSTRFKSTAGVSGQFGNANNRFTLTDGHEYNVRFYVAAFDNASTGTASVIFMRGSAAGGGLNTYKPGGLNFINAVGNVSYDFTFDRSQNNNNDNMQFVVELKNGNLGSKTIDLKRVELIDKTINDTIVWDKSVVGELDITDNENFPLALTFQISDIKDITATSGDYSKTFKVPATKNNNNLLKHLYRGNINVDELSGGHGVDVTENMKCRILINNLFSLTGFLRITGVGGYGDKVSYYNCLFLGNNLGWGVDLEGKYLHQIDWGVNGEGLTYNYTSVESTWDDVDCNSSSSYIVYPIMSHGEYNPDGAQNTIQILKTREESGLGTGKIGYRGMDNSGTNYNNPNPTPDWRPGIWVKDTLEKIFAQVGYKIESTFLDTQIFKQLVWTLPNFKYNNIDERYGRLSLKAIFDKSIALDTHGVSVDYPTPTPTSAQHFLQYAGFGIGLGTLGTGFTYTASTENTEISYVDAASSTWTGFSSYPDSSYPGPNFTTLATGGGSEFTIAEYGYYNIKLSDLSVKIDTLRQNGGSITQSSDSIGGVRHREYEFERINFRIQRQTAGQTSWDGIANCTQTNPQFTGGTVSGTGHLVVAEPNPLGSSIVNPYPVIGTGNTANVDDDINFVKWLNKNDKIRIFVQIKSRPTRDDYNGGASNWQGTYTYNATPIIGNFSLELDTSVVEWGQTYDLQNVISKDLKQLDFVKGITHAFNLKMVTDEVLRKVTLEPFEDFYKSYADAVDYTYKLDYTKLTEDKWLKSDLKRDLIFKYKTDDNDKKVEHRGNTYFEGVLDNFPYLETLSEKFEKGTSEYENPFFAGTYNAKDQETRGAFANFNVNTAPTACLWEEDVSSSSTDRPDKGFDFLPRLLYWNKYNNGPPTTTFGAEDKYAIGQTNSNTGIIFSPTGTSPGVVTGIFPHAVSYNVDLKEYPVLTYGNIFVRQLDNATKTYADKIIVKGLYETYYKTMFEMLKKSPRLRTVYIDLTVTDIVQLDFRKLIYLNGIYYRLNKVVDFQPNKNESTKLELLEFPQLGTFAAKAPALDDITIGTGGTNGPGIPDDGGNIA